MGKFCGRAGYFDDLPHHRGQGFLVEGIDITPITIIWGLVAADLCGMDRKLEVKMGEGVGDVVRGNNPTGLNWI